MLETNDARGGGPSLKERLDTYERGLIEAALAATSGNQRRAAFQLGVLPTTLHEKMKRLGMIQRTARRQGVAAAEAAGLEATAF